MKKSQHVLDLRKVSHQQNVSSSTSADVLRSEKKKASYEEEYAIPVEKELSRAIDKDEFEEFVDHSNTHKPEQYHSLLRDHEESEVFASDPTDINSFSNVTHVKPQRSVGYWLAWLIESFGRGIVFVAKFIRSIFFSPIRLLDSLLDAIAKSLGAMVRFFGKGIYATIKSLRGVEFRPPYYWYKQIGVFLLLGVMVVTPIKIFFEVPKMIQARKQVLGVSTQAIQYYGLFSELKEYVPAALVAKEFLGFNGPKRYLVVFQNNAELRPTGGFMGSYALIDIHNGEITAMDIPGGGFYDLKGYITRKIEAPKPFHIFSPYLQPWNVNWFADFALSSQKLAQYYEWAGGPTVDGVIAFTPNVLEDILEITGPIELPEYDTVITAENFRVQTQHEVEFEYDKEANTPKAFIADMAPLLIEKMFTYAEAEGARDFLELTDVALREKQLLMYSSNEVIQTHISELGWSGEVLAVPQDYMQIVHTNIGGGKTDLVIDEFIYQDTNIYEDGSIVNEVKLTRTHRGDPQDVFEGHDNLDYIRFYVPIGSKLLEADGFTNDDLSDRFKVPTEILEKDPTLAESEKNKLTDLTSGVEIFTESGKTVFGHWIGIKPGQSKTVRIKYQLPFTYDASRPYVLYWQKQSGSQGSKLTTNITIPSNLHFENWAPQTGNTQLINDYTLKYTNDLRTDRILTFTSKK